MSVGFDELFLTTQVSHKLEVFDDAATSFRSEHVYMVKAVARSRFFLRKFQWSGGDSIGEPDIICDFDQWGHPKHKMHGPVIRDGDWFLVLIDLGRTFEPGQQELVHIRHNLHSLEGKFKPCLTHGIRMGGVESVNLTVVLPPSTTRVVTYNETAQDTGHTTKSQKLEPKTMTNSGRMCYEKVRDLEGTETNLRLRLDW